MLWHIEWHLHRERNKDSRPLIPSLIAQGLVGQGFSNKEIGIGTHLCISVATVKHHVHSLFEKLGLTAVLMRCVACGMRPGWRTPRRLGK